MVVVVEYQCFIKDEFEVSENRLLNDVVKFFMNWYP